MTDSVTPADMQHAAVRAPAPSAEDLRPSPSAHIPDSVVEPAASPQNSTVNTSPASVVSKASTSNKSNTSTDTTAPAYDPSLPRRPEVDGIDKEINTIGSRVSRADGVAAADGESAREREPSQEHRSASGSQSPQLNSVSGTKRTASGQLKRSSVNGLADVVAQQADVRHSPSPSAASTGGNVQEISQNLRTKLKYAMVKVQNGWQTRSLDEVESLASQSPRSTMSGFPQLSDGQPTQSPRTVMQRKYQRESSESDSSESAIESRGLAAMTSPQPTTRRGLAPPADILPGARRRPTPNQHHHGQPGLHLQTRQLQPARPASNQRTPSQNAAMEADAVETLLFMASPNNSSYNPPRSSQLSSHSQAFSSQTSPLRTQFSQTSMTSPKRVAFQDQRYKESPVDKAALIDQMLEDLEDDSDDERDLENILRLAGKGKQEVSI